MCSGTQHCLFAVTERRKSFYSLCRKGLLLAPAYFAGRNPEEKTEKILFLVGVKFIIGILLENKEIKKINRII